jgi:hypothetical protein
MIDGLTDRMVRHGRRGRPRQAEHTIVAHVRLTEPIYDAFCRQAIVERVSLHEVLKRTLTNSAPPKPTA